MPKPRALAAAALGVALVGAAVFHHEIAQRAYMAGLLPSYHADGNVVIVVLDTLRADRTSLCGYGRPTSPALDALAARGAWSCSAIAPGTWTLPSHASFFTGQLPPEHGAHELPVRRGAKGTTVIPTTTAAVRPLGRTPATLAERMAELGYHSILVSENPIVGEGTGLARGFEHTAIATDLHTWRGAALELALAAELAKVPVDGKPLLTVVNITESHDPWAEVPAGLDWVSAQPWLELGEYRKDGVWKKFFADTFTTAERAAFVAGLTDSYDWGVRLADGALAGVLHTVESAGRCGENCRIIVVSDHGELLGEHDLIHHGWNPWEENARVPLVLVGFPEVPQVPDNLNAVAVFDLALTGKLPEKLPPSEVVYWPHLEHARTTGDLFFNKKGAIVWEGSTKMVWEEGLAWSYNLAVDPDESTPSLLSDLPPALRRLARLVEAERVGPNEGKDMDVTDALRAAGYLE